MTGRDMFDLAADIDDDTEDIPAAPDTSSGAQPYDIPLPGDWTQLEDHT